MNCNETREHLDGCEVCRLHVAVEARLRTEPVLDPPKGLVGRVMRALPRTGPVRREIFRLTAAAVLLIGLTAGVLLSGLDRHERLDSPRAAVEETFDATRTTVTNWGYALWRR